METDIRCAQCSERFPAHVIAQFGGSCPACVAGFAQVPEDGPLKAGSTFGRYVVGDILGKGGMGVVYRARQRGLDRDVALKVLSPRFAADVDFVRRFEREAKTLASLSHPNIVAVYDTGIEAGTPFLAMELVEGVSLRTLLSQRRLPPEEALGIVPQLCDALEYAHAKGVVHRDIKPENILIDTQGRVKVADYGLAVMTGIDATRLTQASSVLGTPHYMAPEQVENPRAVDHRADIYSMGVVFYEMLTGELPLGHFSMPSAKAKVHRRLDEIVVRALAKEPERRYQRASEVKSDVAAAPRGAGGSAPPTQGLDWRTKRTFFGWPLIHVAMRGSGARARVAKGVIAIGDIAIGGFAFGGVSIGIVALGGLALGLVSLGGLAIAVLLAFGGGAVAGGAAVGGGAVAGYAAHGGGAYAFRYAAGGHAEARYVMSGSRSDVEAERFFAAWGVSEAKARTWKRSFIRETNYHYQTLQEQQSWEEALEKKDVEAAEKLLNPSAEDYGPRLRALGFELLTRRLNRPADGLPYLHRALAWNPHDKDTWKAMEVACRQAGVPYEDVASQGNPYEEGMAAYEAGAYARAWSLLVRTQPSNDNYIKALCLVGDRIFTREWNRPREGIPYLELAYRRAPGNYTLEAITRAYEKAGMKYRPR